MTLASALDEACAKFPNVPRGPITIRFRRTGCVFRLVVGKRRVNPHSKMQVPNSSEAENTSLARAGVKPSNVTAPRAPLSSFRPNVAVPTVSSSGGPSSAPSDAIESYAAAPPVRATVTAFDVGLSAPLPKRRARAAFPTSSSWAADIADTLSTFPLSGEPVSHTTPHARETMAAIIARDLDDAEATRSAQEATPDDEPWPSFAADASSLALEQVVLD